MPTRNVVLTKHHENIIAALVASGRYQNASEVLRDGIRLIEKRDAREAAKLKALQAAALVGFIDLDDGRYRDVLADDLDAVVEDISRTAGEKVRRADD